MLDIIEKLKNKELTLDKVMSRDLYLLVKYYIKTGNKPALDACISEAKNRLKKKGLSYIQGKGWAQK